MNTEADDAHRMPRLGTPAGAAPERLEQDEKELAFEDNERRREYMGLRIAYQRAKTYAFEARLHLRDKKVDAAIGRGRGCHNPGHVVAVGNIGRHP